MVRLRYICGASAVRLRTVVVVVEVVVVKDVIVSAVRLWCVRGAPAAQ